MKMCDCAQGRLPCNCQPQPIAAQSAPDAHERWLSDPNNEPFPGGLSGIPMPALQSAPDEREAFERWLPEHYWLGEMEVAVEDDEYAHAEVQVAWEVWQARAAWQRAQSAPVVPEGWRLVPVVISDAMAEELGAEGTPRLTPYDHAQSIWDSVLAAAPQPAATCATCSGVGIVGHSELCPECSGATQPAAQDKVHCSECGLAVLDCDKRGCFGLAAAQEPVAWTSRAKLKAMNDMGVASMWPKRIADDNDVPLYTHAPAAQDQGEVQRLREALERIAKNAEWHADIGNRPDLITLSCWVSEANAVLSAGAEGKV